MTVAVVSLCCCHCGVVAIFVVVCCVAVTAVAVAVAVGHCVGVVVRCRSLVNGRRFVAIQPQVLQHNTGRATTGHLVSMTAGERAR